MKPNSSLTGKRRKNRARAARVAPELTPEQRDACQAALGYKFKTPDLLDRAMTHRSAAQGHSAEWSNERLEFLGDRVLGLIVVEALLERFPNQREGELAPRLNALVSRDQCGVIGAALGLGDYLIVDKAERLNGGPSKPSLLANAVEAVLGAIYLDGGLPPSRKFILKHWKAAMQGVIASPRDPKSALQEWAQGEGFPMPRYDHAERTGPDHAPVFTASVHVSDLHPASGTGASKQEAERAAARAMMAIIESDEP
jgi:ribonuclease-3